MKCAVFKVQRDYFVERKISEFLITYNFVADSVDMLSDCISQTHILCENEAGGCTET